MFDYFELLDLNSIYFVYLALKSKLNKLHQYIQQHVIVWYLVLSDSYMSKLVGITYLQWNISNILIFI